MKTKQKPKLKRLYDVRLGDYRAVLHGNGDFLVGYRSRKPLPQERAWTTDPASKAPWWPKNRQHFVAVVRALIENGNFDDLTKGLVYGQVQER